MEQEIENLKRLVADLQLELRAKRGEESLPSQPSLAFERGKSPGRRDTPSWGKPSPPYAQGTRGLRNLEQLKKPTLDESSRSSEGVHPSRLPLVPLPIFERVWLNEWSGHFFRWLRLSGVDKATEKQKMDWVIESMGSELKTSIAYLAENVDTLA